MRLLLALALLAASALAAPIDVGTTLPRLALEDQHGNPGAVDERVRVLVFSREMKGGDVVKEALDGVPQQFLDARGIVYVADIARMPAMVTRLFALPRMRRRPYRMLLDRDGTATRDLPSSEGRATVLFLDGLRVTRRGVRDACGAAGGARRRGAVARPAVPAAAPAAAPAD